MQRVRHGRALAYPRVPLTEAMFQRAIDFHGQLAVRRVHRLPVPDLVIAAAAEAAELVVLRYGTDLDRLAAVTGQAAKCVVPRGSL